MRGVLGVLAWLATAGGRALYTGARGRVGEAEWTSYVSSRCLELASWLHGE